MRAGQGEVRGNATADHGWHPECRRQIVEMIKRDSGSTASERASIDRMDKDIIHRMASRLVEDHGDDAIKLAIQWIDEAAEADDDFSVQLWDEVYSVLEGWQAG